MIIGPFIFSNPDVFPFGIAAIIITILLIYIKSELVWYKKLLFTFSRILFLGALFIALANPHIMANTSALQGGTLTILFDNSTSMKPYGITPSSITELLGNKLPTTTQVIAEGNTSPLIHRITSSLSPFGQFLIISDGQATDGDDFQAVVKTALRLNATLNTFALNSEFKDAGVTIEGPKKTLAGASNKYLIKIVGNTELEGTLSVKIDGEEVLNTKDLERIHTVEQIFFESSQHTVEANLLIDDIFEENDNFYFVTRVVPKPKIAYFGTNTRFQSFISDIFDVKRIDGIPDNIDAYSAVIIHNQDAKNIKAIELENFISNGGGLALLGGTNSFDFGGYDKSDIAPLIPVKAGRSGGKKRAAVVIAIDISGSTSSGFSEGSQNTVTDIEKSLAYDITDSLGNDNLLGIIAFNTEAFLVSELTMLGQGRDGLLDKISRLQHSGGTRLNVGLSGAYNLVKELSGGRSVIFISDGQAGGDNDGPKASTIAKKMSRDGIQLFTIGVGQATNEPVMRGLAKLGGGLYLRPQETDRLHIQFGRSSGQAVEQSTFSLSIFDTDHIITQGLSNSQSTLNNVNRVIPKQGARPLVMTSQGDVALTTWNYGLGRVAAWTAYTGAEDLGNMLSAKDSTLIVRFLTWAAGDPETSNPPLLTLEDTTFGTSTEVTAHATSLEELAKSLNTTINELGILHLKKTKKNTFKGIFLPSKYGFNDVFGAKFAVNSPDEFRSIGETKILQQIPLYTKGKYLNRETLNEIIGSVNQNLAEAKTPVSYAWLAMVIGLIIFLIELTVRKTAERLTHE